MKGATGAKGIVGRHALHLPNRTRIFDGHLPAPPRIAEGNRTLTRPRVKPILFQIVRSQDMDVARLPGSAVGTRGGEVWRIVPVACREENLTLDAVHFRFG